MATTGAVSGRYGDVKIGSTQVCDVSKWSFNPKIQINSYASNCTSQTKKKVAGVKDGSGSLEGYYNPANPIMGTIDVGTSVTLKLYLTATVYYQVPAIIESLKVDVDIDSGDFVKWSADFQADGVWTNPVASQRVQPPMGADGEPLADEPVAGSEGQPQSTLQETVSEMVAAQVSMMRHELIEAASQTAALAAVTAIKEFLASREQPASQAA